jgi:hypothetical protein
VVKDSTTVRSLVVQDQATSMTNNKSQVSPKNVKSAKNADHIATNQLRTTVSRLTSSKAEGCTEEVEAVQTGVASVEEDVAISRCGAGEEVTCLSVGLEDEATANSIPEVTIMVDSVTIAVEVTESSEVVKTIAVAQALSIAVAEVLTLTEDALISRATLEDTEAEMTMNSVAADLTVGP